MTPSQTAGLVEFPPDATSVVTKIKHLYRSGSKMQRGQVRAWMARVLADQDGAR